MVALRLAGSEWGCGRDVKAFADQTFGFLRWASLHDGDVTPAEAVAVQFSQGGRRQFRGGHGDETVASRLAGGWVQVQLDRGNSADPGKE